MLAEVRTSADLPQCQGLHKRVTKTSQGNSKKIRRMGERDMGEVVMVTYLIWGDVLGCAESGGCPELKSP